MDLAHTVKTNGLQNRVRQTMRSSRTFQIESDIPDDLLRQLARLDRAIEEKKA